MKRNIFLFSMMVFAFVSLTRAQDLPGQHGLFVAPSFSFQQYFGQSVNLSTGAKASAFLGWDDLYDGNDGYRVGILAGGGSNGTSLQTEAQRLLLPADLSFVITPYWTIKTSDKDHLGLLLSIDCMTSTLQNFQTKTYYTPGSLGLIGGVFFESLNTNGAKGNGGWGLGVRIRQTQNLWNGINEENLFSVSSLETVDLSEYLEFTFPDSLPNPTTVKIQGYEYLAGDISSLATGPVFNLELTQSFDLVTPAQSYE